MNGFEFTGRLMVGVGIVLLVVGGLVWLLSKAELFGQLPGDIRIERDGFSCLVPIASSIILSLVLTLVLNIIVRLINR